MQGKFEEVVSAFTSQNSLPIVLAGLNQREAVCELGVKARTVRHAHQTSVLPKCLWVGDSACPLAVDVHQPAVRTQGSDGRLAEPATRIPSKAAELALSLLKRGNVKEFKEAAVPVLPN
eukprot:75783-Amphidinium_carterae.2